MIFNIKQITTTKKQIKRKAKKVKKEKENLIVKKNRNRIACNFFLYIRQQKFQTKRTSFECMSECFNLFMQRVGGF